MTIAGYMMRNVDYLLPILLVFLLSSETLMHNFNQIAAFKPARQFDEVINTEDGSDPGYIVVMEGESGEELEEPEGHCVWYGQCSMGWNQGAFNCPLANKTRDSPLLTDPDGLKRYCPQLYTDYSAHGPCIGGFIPSVNNVMTDEYANTLYASCKDVQMPSANDKAMFVFCGRKAKDCSPTIWLSYLGNTGNGTAPFPINYNYTKTTILNPHTQETMYLLNNTNLHCNVTYANASDDCSCQDCQSSCAPVPPPPPKAKSFTILGVDGSSFITACISIAVVIFLGTYVICFSILKKDCLGVGKKENAYTFEDGSTAESQQNRSNRQVSPAEIGNLEKLGLRIEELFKAGFTSRGRVCARYQLILATIIIFGSLAEGIRSSSQSTTRTQKAYFDKHFGPFFRTEQLIITRTDKTPVKHIYPPPSTDTVNFSSMFDKEFMHQVLDLQTELEQITAKSDNDIIGLQDICVKPLSPDNNNCTIQSILQFWQNDHTNLDKLAYDEYKLLVIADYLDHFLKCAQAPASVSDTTALEMTCRAAYGGPTFPWVVLRGYDALNYQNATAFVITYVLNNHENEEDNRNAEAWEAEFIKFIKYYKSPNMTISLSSEVFGYMGIQYPIRKDKGQNLGIVRT